MSRIINTPPLDRRQFLGAALMAGFLACATNAAGAPFTKNARTLYIADDSFGHSEAFRNAAAAAGGRIVQPQTFIDNRWLMDASPLARDFARVAGLTTYADRHLMVDALRRAGFSLQKDTRLVNCQRTDARCAEGRPLAFGPTSEIWHWEVWQG